MSTLKTVAGGVSVLAVMAHGLALAATGGDRAAFAEINGSIELHGCQIDSGELMVRARPVLPPRQSREIGLPDQRSQVVKVSPGATPEQFEFRFPGVVEGAPYRLGVKLVGASARRCGRLVWTSLRDPLTVAGEQPLVLRGYTVAAEIAVRGETMDSRAQPGWFGADALDFDSAAAGTRVFRWRSMLPGVTGGRLQVALKPFPDIDARGYRSCDTGDDNRIIHEVDFSAVPGEWTTVPVDFHAVLAGGRTDADVRVDAVDDGAPSRVGLQDRAALAAGRPIHVRVLPTEAGEPICDPDRAGVPPTVRLAKLLASLTGKQQGEPVFSIETIYYSKPEFDDKHPKAGEMCYRTTRSHLLCDAESGCFDATWDYALAYNTSKYLGDTVGEGYQFCVPNSYWQSDEDGWLESFVNSFGSVLTAVVDAAGKLVNFASALWEDIQDYAVDAVASGLDAIPGVNCGDVCQQALETGLEVGLATMGVPPSLPNFDQLLDQGADYLAAQAGAQLGVPGVLTDYASDEAQKFIKQAVKHMKNRAYSVKGLPDWLTPDIRFQPAVLTLDLYGNGAMLPSAPGIVRAGDPIYAGKFVQLPRLLPKKETIPIPGHGDWTRPPLRFPMVLDANLAGLTPAPAGKNEYDAAVWDKQQWLQNRYRFGPLQGCYHLLMVGLAPVGDLIFNLTDLRFTTQDAQACAW